MVLQTERFRCSSRTLLYTGVMCEWREGLPCRLAQLRSQTMLQMMLVEYLIP